MVQTQGESGGTPTRRGFSARDCSSYASRYVNTLAKRSCEGGDLESVVASVVYTCMNRSGPMMASLKDVYEGDTESKDTHNWKGILG